MTPGALRADVHTAARPGDTSDGSFARSQIGLVVPADPQLVLLLLPPLERKRSAVDFKLKIVFVARQHLADGKTASCAVSKRSSTLARSSAFTCIGCRSPPLVAAKASADAPEE